MLDNLVNDLKKIEEVKAIALGGSRATGLHQEDSDFDVYVYVTKHIEEKTRIAAIDKHVSFMEYSNHFWELEDDGVLNSGIEIELIYREIEDFNGLINPDNVGHGYTTCFIDNVLSCKVLYDCDNLLGDLKEKLKGSLNEELIQRIVDYNFPIIKDKIPALTRQFKKAVKRNDLHSINHRLTEYFAIYHDILFAINHEYHKGEKRLLTLVEKFDNVPLNHVELTNKVYQNAFSNGLEAVESLDQLSDNLETLLKELKYI